MTEIVDDKATPERSSPDWALIEKDYRVGLKSLRTIAEEHGITEGAIRKRAKRDQWTRNLEERIQERAKEKVRKEAVRTPSTQITPTTERAVVEAYSDVVAEVEIIQRADLKGSLNTARVLLGEIAALSDPRFAENLERLGEMFDESGVDEETGREIKDKANETYRYIISLPGRVKMLKELAATHGVYQPLQRKAFGLDGDKKQTSEFEDLLARIGRA